MDRTFEIVVAREIDAAVAWNLMYFLEIYPTTPKDFPKRIGQIN
jgi:hypothetical protein